MEAMDGKIIETILRHPRRRSFRHTFLALSRHDVDSVAAHSKAPCEFHRQYLGSRALPCTTDFVSVRSSSRPSSCGRDKNRGGTSIYPCLPATRLCESRRNRVTWNPGAIGSRSPVPPNNFPRTRLRPAGGTRNPRCISDPRGISGGGPHPHGTKGKTILPRW